MKEVRENEAQLLPCLRLLTGREIVEGTTAPLLATPHRAGDSRSPRGQQNQHLRGGGLTLAWSYGYQQRPTGQQQRPL